jgi:hypothetical protein
MKLIKAVLCTSPCTVDADLALRDILVSCVQPKRLSTFMRNSSTDGTPCRV